MPSRLLPLLALVALGSPLAPWPALAQRPLCGAEALTRGDTTAAAVACEHAIAENARDTEAYYRLGRLYEAVGSRAAEEQYRLATRYAPDSAKYWLALAAVLRAQDNVFARQQVGGVVDRAREAARAHGGTGAVEAEYRSALVAWDRYEQYANRYLFAGDAVAVDPYVLMGEWKEVDDFFQRQVRPDPGDPGGDDRRAAEDYLRATLASDPRHVAAAGLLTVLLLETDRGEEAVELARHLVRAAPDSGRAWALLGTALVRTLAWPAAAAAFDTALRRLSPAERAPYGNLGLLLKGVDQARFGTLAPAQQAQLDSLYWAVSQPLFLADVNEVRLEFYARLTYVLHRWTDPFRGVHGFETDRGGVYLRYGPPDVWAAFGRGRQSQRDAVEGLESERNTIVWLYRGPQLRFLFTMTPGFARTTFSSDFRSYYEAQRNLFPVRFDNVPAVAEMDTILVQFAQFRGQTLDSTDLGVFSLMPIGRMARRAAVGDLPISVAAVVRDGRMRTVARVRRDETIRAGDALQIERRSFRFSLLPAEYLLRVEAQLPSVERAARSTSLLSLRRYGTDSLMLSDVLVADRVAPRDSTFTRWTDFLVSPSTGRFTPDAPVGLLWEIYNLQPDSTGTARYRIDLRITVKDIERRGFAARILGGIGDAVGLSAKGDDEVALSYDREVTMGAGGHQVEFLTVDLEDAPSATYGITVRVTDRVSGRAVEGRRQILVAPDAGRR